MKIDEREALLGISARPYPAFEPDVAAHRHTSGQQVANADVETGHNLQVIGPICRPRQDLGLSIACGSEQDSSTIGTPQRGRIVTGIGGDLGQDAST